jgi:archaellum component FlaF (FlaF/FlaG flagellin family)
MKKIVAITAAAVMILGLSQAALAAEDYVTSNEEVEMFAEAATIQETVLVDEADVKITAKALTYDSWSATLSLNLVNNTDQDLNFYSTPYEQCWNSINGIMSDFYFSESVKAGKKANSSITFYTDDLLELGITDIAEIELSFDIEDENYDTYLKTDVIKLETSIADTYEYPDTPALSALTNAYVLSEVDYSTLYYSDEPEGEGDVVVTAKWMGTDWSDDTLVKLEIHNGSDQRIVIKPLVVSLNGLYVSASSSDAYIAAGKTGIVEMTLDYLVDANVRSWVGLDEIGKVSVVYAVEDEEENMIGGGTANIEIPGAPTEADYAGIELVNESGIKLEGVAVTQENSTYSNDVFFIFVVENNSGKDIELGCKYGESSVNGYMTSLSSNYPAIPDGEKGLYILTLYDWYFDDCDIESFEDITDMEAVFQAFEYGSYTTIVEAPIGLYFEAAEAEEEMAG